MDEQCLIRRAKELHKTTQLSLYDCAAKAVYELVPAEEMARLGSLYDITINDLIDDIYQKMEGGTK